MFLRYQNSSIGKRFTKKHTFVKLDIANNCYHFRNYQFYLQNEALNPPVAQPDRKTGIKGSDAMRSVKFISKQTDDKLAGKETDRAKKPISYKTLQFGGKCCRFALLIRFLIAWERWITYSFSVAKREV